MNDLSEFVTLTDTTLTTDSRRVARHFRKLHKNVLQAAHLGRRDARASRCLDACTNH